MAPAFREVIAAVGLREAMSAALSTPDAEGTPHQDLVKWCTGVLASHGVTTIKEWAEIEQAGAQFTERIVCSLGERLTTLQIARVHSALNRKAQEHQSLWQAVRGGSIRSTAGPSSELQPQPRQGMGSQKEWDGRSPAFVRPSPSEIAEPAAEGPMWPLTRVFLAYNVLRFRPLEIFIHTMSTPKWLKAMVHANHGAHLRQTLFDGTANLVATSLMLACAVALLVFDLSQPFIAPLHIVCLTLDLICATFSLAALTVTYDVANLFAPVHDVNLNAAAKACLFNIWLSKICWIPSVYSLALAMFAAAMRPVCGPGAEISWFLREQPERLPAMVLAIPILIQALVVMLMMPPILCSVNAAALTNAHSGTFSSRPVLPMGALSWSPERVRRALAHLALDHGDLDVLYSQELRQRREGRSSRRLSVRRICVTGRGC